MVQISVTLDGPISNKQFLPVNLVLSKQKAPFFCAEINYFSANIPGFLKFEH
jgi:hypothetical protein